MSSPARPFCSIALVLLFVAAAASVADAQSAPRSPWTLTAAFTGLRTGATAGWLYGPELGIRRDFGPRWGVLLRASLQVLDTEVFTDDGAAAMDVGPTLTFASGKVEYGLAAGATGLLVSDVGELIASGLGAFADAHATVGLSRTFGLVAGTNVRIAGDGSTYPSLSLGVAARF